MQTMRNRSTPSRPPGSRTADPGHGEDLTHLSDEELDGRIAAGLEVWSGIQDALLATGGMPPSRKLAAQVVDYLEGFHWQAEEARIEAFRRQCFRASHRSVDRTRSGWSLA